MCNNHSYDVVVLCGPSGSGKDTIRDKLFENYPDLFVPMKSHLTRSPRPGEEARKDLIFVTLPEFERLIEMGTMVQYAKYLENYYGTSWNSLNEAKAEQKVPVLILNIDGVKQMKRTTVKALYVFIEVPVDVLRTRLRARNTDPDEVIEKRIAEAYSELEYGEAIL